ncbi:MAG: hypothetical protein ACKO9I_04075 [Sphaerospermopsis kisseleviana]|uniref:Uncharacterized protein n=1 Tax=Sphaerospermopsis reniformis TaxID=531300 RepID=A0A480A9K5_9CYAN|nr:MULTISPECIES: hypothetical protein [Sphaerospermopsis]MBC5797854.1 hypothetical protein [Sphaerospermopsis sp. LEGE 00249]GCL39948.1 hypothetical protein SR1949_50790 [Sphaerospermopsis reniformis]
MNNLTLETLFKEIDNLTEEEKIELVNYLNKQIQKQPGKNTAKNLVELFQTSPLVGVDLDLERQKDFDHRNFETLAAAFQELQQICIEENYDLEIPSRQNRPTPFD